MTRFLPRTPRGTWLLAGILWLVACGVLWWLLPDRPRAAWPTDDLVVIYGFIPGTSVLLTSSPWPGGTNGPGGPMLGPLVARDAETHALRHWFPDGERLTLVDPGVDGRHVLVGRVLGGRARLFLVDATNGNVIAELPRGGPAAENESDLPRDASDQFAAFRRDGQRIVYADWVGEERWLRVWEVETHQEVAALRDAGPPAAWSPDGRSLAYITQGRDESAVGLWNVDAGGTRALASSPFGQLRAVQIHFSPDGQSVVCGLQVPVFTFVRARFEDNEIIGWEVASGRQTFRRQTRRAVFPAGLPWFVTEESDQPRAACLHRCDYGTGAERDRVVLSEITEPLWVGLSPDAGLVLGHDVIDNPVLEFLDVHVLQGALGISVRPVIWDATSGRLLHVLPMAIGSDLCSATGQAWSADGKLLAIAGEDDLAVWHMPPRKRLWWFGAGATLLALPIVVFVRRRSRSLRLP